MFTWRHIVWLIISAGLIAAVLYFYEKKKPALNKVLTSACVVCIASEFIKVMSVIEMVPSAGGTIIRPYLPLNHMPLHFCSIQVLLILFAKFSDNRDLKEKLLAFICPTALIGALFALAMPSIFTTSVSVEKAFVSPISYQFFIYHSMLVALGIIILRAGEINWRKKYMYMTIVGTWTLGFISIYVNSMLASPTYADGKLISVDFWPNFFFTYNAPVNIAITEKWQWMIYILVMIALSGALIAAFYRIFIFRKMRDKASG